MSVPDRSERAQQRRRREARARKVLTAASVLSFAAGTVTIYAANAGSSESGTPAATPFAVLKPVIVADPTSIPTTEPEQDEPAVENDDEGEDEPAATATLPNVTVPPTPTAEATSTPTPEIVIEQPSSHSRSRSTPG